MIKVKESFICSRAAYLLSLMLKLGRLVIAGGRGPVRQSRPNLGTMFEVFVSLYSWADQAKEERPSWEKTKSSFKKGFCDTDDSCQFQIFYDNWSKDFFGVRSKGIFLHRFIRHTINLSKL